MVPLGWVGLPMNFRSSIFLAIWVTFILSLLRMSTERILRELLRNALINEQLSALMSQRYHVLIMQDERYNTIYREEYGKPDTRKTKFVATAESMLNNMRKTE